MPEPNPVLLDTTGHTEALEAEAKHERLQLNIGANAQLPCRQHAPCAETKWFALAGVTHQQHDSHAGHTDSQSSQQDLPEGAITAYSD